MRLSAIAVLLLACHGSSPAPSDAGKTAPSHAARVAVCLPTDAQTLEVYLDLVADRCNIPKNLRSALKAAVFAEGVEARSKLLLTAARSDPRFRSECAVDDAVAARPMVEHPNVDRCTHDAAFAADPWGTDFKLFCSVDIGTYLFLDIVAAHLWADEGGPWQLEEPGKRDTTLRRVITTDASDRSLRCAPDHPNLLARRERLKKAADAWNQVVASGDGGVP